MPKRAIEAADRLLTRVEVAQLFRVTTAAVSRWDREGRFGEGAVIRLPSGHRRWKEAAVRELLARETAP